MNSSSKSPSTTAVPAVGTARSRPGGTDPALQARFTAALGRSREALRAAAAKVAPSPVAAKDRDAATHARTDGAVARSDGFADRTVHGAPAARAASDGDKSVARSRGEPTPDPRTAERRAAADDAFESSSGGTHAGRSDDPGGATSTPSLRRGADSDRSAAAQSAEFAAHSADRSATDDAPPHAEGGQPPVAAACDVDEQHALATLTAPSPADAARALVPGVADAGGAANAAGADRVSDTGVTSSPSDDDEDLADVTAVAAAVPAATGPAMPGVVPPDPEPVPDAGTASAIGPARATCGGDAAPLAASHVAVGAGDRWAGSSIAGAVDADPARDPVSDPTLLAATVGEGAVAMPQAFARDPGNLPALVGGSAVDVSLLSQYLARQIGHAERGDATLRLQFPAGSGPIDQIVVTREGGVLQLAVRAAPSAREGVAQSLQSLKRRLRDRGLPVGDVVLEG